MIRASAMPPGEVGALAAGHPVLTTAAALGALAGVLLACRLARRALRGPRAEDVLTLAAAGIATGVAAQGMWRFFGDVLQFSGVLRVLLFAFIEVAVVTSAVRARANMREFGAAGLDGAAVWTLTGLSAVLSTMDARSVPEALFRLAAPMVAAWLWERGMALDRRRAGGTRIHWRLTPERALVRLGLAEAADRSTGEVAAGRRLAGLARAAKKLRAVRAAGASARRQRRAAARLDRAMARAVEHAGLATDPARQEALLAHLGALYHAAALADFDPPTPWALPYAVRTVPHPPAAGSRTAHPELAPAARVRPSHPQTRTGPTPATRPTREDVVDELAAAMLADPTGWRPDYPDLMTRTGYGRSWCEKRVAEARAAAEAAETGEPARRPTEAGEPAT
jgi:hypothetical protein